MLLVLETGGYLEIVALLVLYNVSMVTLQYGIEIKLLFISFGLYIKDCQTWIWVSVR